MNKTAVNKHGFNVAEFYTFVLPSLNHPHEQNFCVI